MGKRRSCSREWREEEEEEEEEASLGSRSPFRGNVVVRAQSSTLLSLSLSLSSSFILRQRERERGSLCIMAQTLFAK